MKKIMITFLFLFLIVYESELLSGQESDSGKDLTFIFKSAEEGYNTFRIPAIIATKNGSLLSFAEGRKNGSSDSGDIDLVMKRSDDYGKTWSALKVIRDDGSNVCGNPAPVQDEKTGIIYLLSTWNLGTDRESDIINGTSRDTRRVFIMRSVDDGITWSEPEEITSYVKPDSWSWYATGPCHGIRIRKGRYSNRMVIPCDHIETTTKKYYSHIIYSDDHGLTWNIGGITPQDQVNECTVTEISGGRLMLNMRNYDRSKKTRKVAISNDGGIHWSNIYADTILVEPICQASILTFSLRGNKPAVILFLNPADEDKRVNMTLRISYDDGSNWQKSIVLYKGPSAYSDMALLKSSDLGVIFEAGKISPYEGIVFRIVPRKEISR
jgi:sialidase-1